MFDNVENFVDEHGDKAVVFLALFSTLAILVFALGVLPSVIIPVGMAVAGWATFNTIRCLREGTDVVTGVKTCCALTITHAVRCCGEKP